MCRAGRALLGWSQEELAKAAGVGLSTVRGFEAGKTEPVSANLRAIEKALHGGGCVFLRMLGAKDARAYLGVSLEYNTAPYDPDSEDFDMDDVEIIGPVKG